MGEFLSLSHLKTIFPSVHSLTAFFRIFTIFVELELDIPDSGPIQYRRLEWNSALYNIFRFLASRHCFALLRQKSALDSLFVKNLAWELKDSVSSRNIPSSLYDFWSEEGWAS